MGISALILLSLGVKLALFINDHQKESQTAPIKVADFEKALTKLQTFDGQDFTTYKSAGPPKYYLLYFAASW